MMRVLMVMMTGESLQICRSLRSESFLESAGVARWCALAYADEGRIDGACAAYGRQAIAVSQT